MPKNPLRNFDFKHVLEEGFQQMQKFITKFNNDWVMSSAAGLAYNLLVALTPIAIALISILGFIVGGLSPDAQKQLINHIQQIFSLTSSSVNVLQPALTSLSKNAGFLGIIAVIAALFGGSRLFIAIENYFDIIYRTIPRKPIRQNIMALLMLLVYIILTPFMIFASSVPALLLALVNSTLNQIPGVAQFTQNSPLLSIAGILGSLLVSWIFFEVTYLVVPNQKISFKNSWKGAVISAILLQFFLVLFPLYTSHFMSNYTGQAGFAVIFLVFLYYFAVILLLGAEVNAYFAEGVQPLPTNVAAVLRDP
jgi:membrane protein